MFALSLSGTIRKKVSHGAGSQKAVKQPGSTHGVATREETMTNASSSARGRGVKFTPQTIEKIKEFGAEGLSRDEIANRLGVTVGSLQVTCSRLELFSPNGSRHHTADIKSRSWPSSR